MRVRFIKKTKDSRPNSNGWHLKDSIYSMSKSLGSYYVKKGDAVEIDEAGNTISKPIKIEKDGKI